MKLFLVAAASLAVVSCASLSMEDQEFHAWKLKFGKVYKSPEEEARRKDIWLSTRHTVLAHNILADQGIKTYRMGMNHFSDMDEQEYISLHRSLPPIGNSYCAEFFQPKDDRLLPRYVNWGDKGCVTRVKNQRYPCGSCWAFSAVGALESHTCIKYKHKHKNKHPTPLSVQQLVDCSGSYGNHGCTNGTYTGAFQYCVDKGVVTEESYKYLAKETPCHFDKKPVPDSSIGARCSGCRYAGGQESTLQRVVAEIGPVSITIPINDTFKDYKSGIYECDRSPPDTTPFHDMLVVGYGTTKSGAEYWRVKNSYGASWGEKGFIRIARNKTNTCNIATWAYYPVVK